MNRLTKALTKGAVALMGLGAMFAASALPAQAESGYGIFGEAASYYFGGEDGGNHAFYVDPSIDAGMTEDQRDDIENRVSEMDYWTFVAQVDQGAAADASNGRSYPAVLNDAIKEQDFDSTETYVVAVVTGDHIDARAYGDFSQSFKNRLDEKTREVNRDDETQANPYLLIQKWSDKVEYLMSNGDVLDIPDSSDDPSDDQTDEASNSPEPTATVTKIETKTVTATPSATDEASDEASDEATEASSSASPSQSVAPSDQGTGVAGIVAVVLGVLALAVAGTIVGVYAHRNRGNHEQGM